MGSIVGIEFNSMRDGIQMTLEQQLEKLAKLGFKLNDGISIDDLLYSCDREEYESEPYDTIMFILGSEVEREPWGRYFCDQVWNFDVECIEDSGAYVTIVENMCRIAGLPNLITNLKDYVDLDNGEAWLKYTIDGKNRHFNVRVDDDWADPDTVSAVMTDIERNGQRFYAIDNGQASILFFLDKEIARELNELTGNMLKAY